jgi:acyl-coenzyme A synthetase/AMP-(fatty) acid ligase
VLDTAHPRDRNATILADARPAAVLLPDEGRQDIDLPPGTQRLTLAAARNSAASMPAGTLDPDEPALVHYTSGSTGRPKGIVISSRAMLRRSLVYLDAWHITASDRFIGTTQPSTNSGFCSSLGALCGGARLLVQSLASEGAGSLLALARNEGLTLMCAGPSVVRLLFSLEGAREAFSQLRVLRSSGETVLQADIANWRAILPRGCHIAHAYASTEAMFGAHWFVPPDYAAAEPRLPAGHPLADQDYALVDEAGRNVPPGEAGELVLRSRHVASGEWRDGTCVPGRMQPIRRCRAGASSAPARRRNAALRQPRRSPGEGAWCPHRTGGDLQDRLRTELLPAMRPSRIVMLERMPYLPGGKVDLRALPEPESQLEPRLGARLRSLITIRRCG